jgi:nicotinamide-nucleotide amidase
MQNERSCSLCLLKEPEVAPFLEELKKAHPHVEMELFPGIGNMHIRFQAACPLDSLVDAVQRKFPSFFYGEGNIEEVLQKEFVARGKTLALAESCTGGAIAATLVAVPDASKYLVGSIVAYSPSWKERFLQVSRTTLQKKGAESKETVIEMAKGLIEETSADYVVAVSGIAGPGGGSKEHPVGTVYIAIGERGQRIDAGVVFLSANRTKIIEEAVQIALGALWRRLVHNTLTFS